MDTELFFTLAWQIPFGALPVALALNLLTSAVRTALRGRDRTLPDARKFSEGSTLVLTAKEGKWTSK